MIKEYPHAEINQGAEVLLRRNRKGLRAELAKSLATRPLMGVGACFAMGLLLGGAVTLGAVKASEQIDKSRKDRSRAGVLPFPVQTPEPQPSKTARLFRFGGKRGEE
jgi:hypothetical protein